MPSGVSHPTELANVGPLDEQRGSHAQAPMNYREMVSTGFGNSVKLNRHSVLNLKSDPTEFLLLFLAPPLPFDSVSFFFLSFFLLARCV